MLKLADLIEANADQLAQLEALDNGKPVAVAKAVDVAAAASCFRYFGGWADKVQGKTLPIDGNFFATRGTNRWAWWGRLSRGISP